MIILYNLILVLCFPLAAFYFLFIQKKYSWHSIFRDVAERFGFWVHDIALDRDKKIVWVHCASLGEVRAIEPVLKQLRDCWILITTLTWSGKQYAIDNNIAQSVYFAPLDFSFLTGRLMKKIKPAALILIETELWPGMMRAAHNNGVPIYLVNARLSLGSFPWYHLTRFFWRDIIRLIDHLLARSSEDAERLIKIGYDPQKVVITGNIKYDRVFPRPPFSREDIGFSAGELILTAGSVRDGEEDIVVDVWQTLRVAYPHLRLIIAPRHTHAVPKVADVLSKRGISYRLRSQQIAQRSSAPNPPHSGECLLIDTFGELVSMYALSDVAFVGGSLVRRGGQNPIEPAAYGIPVLFGNDMSNFETEAKVLEDFGGGFRINNKEEFCRSLERLLKDPAARVSAGSKAVAAVESQRGALAKTMHAIRQVV
ncbi:MAG: 3-deoxy-D-manno-octulosonic acid transferase [Endomicrobiales bacterium]